MNRCRSCGAKVHWLSNTKTRRMAPIDIAAVRGGNVDIDLDEGTYTVRLSDPAKYGHTNHFATCAQAAQWHKGESR